MRKGSSNNSLETILDTLAMVMRWEFLGKQRDEDKEVLPEISSGSMSQLSMNFDFPQIVNASCWQTKICRWLC